jgi:apolipoprotein N-acyltransferase
LHCHHLYHMAAGMMTIERSRTWRDAAILGWAFGFGHFLSGLYWIGYSFLVEADRFGIFAVPAVLGLSACLALFPAVASATTKLIDARGAAQVLAFAAAWTAMEWLRGHVLTGFPWNLIGYVWTVSDAPIQFAALAGIYGLSFLTVIIASLPLLTVVSGRAGLSRWAPLGAAIALAAALWAGGIVRLSGAGSTEVTDIRLRLVQANVPQTMKWDPAQRQRIVSRFLELSSSDDTAPITHLVWPETALPFLLAEEPELRAAVRTVIPAGGALLTGSLRREQAPNGQQEWWNSLLAVDDAGAVVAAYDKAHVVPFGEYMPFRSLLPFKKLTEGTIDFSTGPGRKTISVAGLPPFSPLICYEIIFPGAVIDQHRRPNWLLNVTNDAWFGDSIGPYQHFAMARVRAVEEGLPLVRAANTGISAVVDSYGRVVAQLELNETGVVDAPLPQALAAPTPYARLRDLPLMMFLAAGLLGGLATRRLPITRKE